MEVDQALAVVGGYRRWHMASFFLLSTTAMVVVASNSMVIVFIGRMSPHHCRVPYDVPLNQSVPLDYNTGELSQCSMYINSTWSNKTTTCTDGWTYSPTDGEKTIVMEWDLVCDRNMYSDLTQVYYQIGAILGEVAGSILCDRYGRRLVHISSYVIVASFGCGLAFVQSYTAFSILRAFIAFGVAGGVSAGVTHLFELFDSKRRATIGIGLEYFWSFGYMYTALVGWLVKDWRQMQLIFALTSLAGLINICIMESPMWLLANHRDDEAEEALQKMARRNGVTVPSKLLRQDHTQEKSYPLLNDHNFHELKVESGGDNGAMGGATEEMSRNHERITKKATKMNSTEPPEETGHETIWDLFRWPLLRKYMIISILLWFADYLVYYYLVLSTPTLAGDLNLNFFISAVVEIPGFILANFLVTKSRRIPTCAFHVLSGLSLVSLAFIPQTTESGTDLSYLIVTVAMLGKFSVSLTFTFIILYCREYFPTNLRGTSGGVGNLLGRVGNLIAPFASYAARSVPWVPNVILGALCLAVALLVLMLPETKDWPLPQSIADVYRYTRGEHRRRLNIQRIGEEVHI